MDIFHACGRRQLRLATFSSCGTNGQCAHPCGTHTGSLSPFLSFFLSLTLSREIVVYWYSFSNNLSRHQMTRVCPLGKYLTIAKYFPFFVYHPEPTRLWCHDQFRCLYRTTGTRNTDCRTGRTSRQCAIQLFDVNLLYNKS